MPPANVIPWNSHETVKCPIGSVAAHHRWGRVRVLATSGWNRLVEALQPLGDAARGLRGRRIALIDVRELSIRREDSPRT